MREVLTLLAVSMVAACARIGTLEFTDSNNYSYESTISIQSVPAAPGVEPCFDWSQLTTDIRGRPFDGDVDEAYFTLMEQSQEATIIKFEQNTFLNDDAAAPYGDNPSDEERSVCANEFEVAGNRFEVDDFIPGGDWLITLAKARNSPAGGVDPVMSLFVVPEEGSTTSEFAVRDDSMTLTIDALDLMSAPRIPVSRRTNKADWSNVMQDVYGNSYSNQDGDDLFLAWFDVSSVAEIEEQFLTLDTAAAELYRRRVATFVTLEDLSSATDAQGRAFPGFRRDGIWVFGIACSQCTNPAPLLLSVLDVQ